MVLTERDRRVIADVASFQVLTRAQLTLLGHFSSKTRGNATLARLVRHGFLSRRHQPSVAGTSRALYFAGPAAQVLLNTSADTHRNSRRRLAVLSDLFLDHQLLVTDVRLAFVAAGPECQDPRWRNESELRALNLGLIPDGHIEYSSRGKRFGAFVEIDRGTEDLTRWVRKVQAYVLLARSDRYRSIFTLPFYRVLVIAESDGRLRNLRKATAQLTDRIFWFTTHERLLKDGPFHHIWQRPVDAASHALTES